MTIEATPGLATSNSYATVAEADLYHGARLHNSEWTCATTDSKERALKWATRILGSLSWVGSKATQEQSLAWPRSGVTDSSGYEVDSGTIPAEIKDATAEYAWELLKADREIDASNKGIKSVMAGEVEVEFDKYDRASKTPTSIYRLVSQYLYGSGNFSKIRRV